MDESPRSTKWDALFWFGLAGVIATGVLVGAGGDNLWTASFLNPPFGTEPHIIGRGQVLLVLVVVMTALLDLCALGVIFAGVVIVVQRLRGRM
jgi:hypothetical protein